MNHFVWDIQEVLQVLQVVVLVTGIRLHRAHLVWFATRRRSGSRDIADRCHLLVRLLYRDPAVAWRAGKTATGARHDRRRLRRSLSAEKR